MPDTAISVDAVDTSKKNSDIVEAGSDVTTVSMDLQDAKCFWNDVEYSRGARVNSEGKVYERGPGCESTETEQTTIRKSNFFI